MGTTFETIYYFIFGVFFLTFVGFIFSLVKSFYKNVINEKTVLEIEL
jgi:hypothetical protein